MKNVRDSGGKLGRPSMVQSKGIGEENFRFDKKCVRRYKGVGHVEVQGGDIVDELASAIPDDISGLRFILAWPFFQARIHNSQTGVRIWDVDRIN